MHNEIRWQLDVVLIILDKVLSPFCRFLKPITAACIVVCSSIRLLMPHLHTQCCHDDRRALFLLHRLGFCPPEVINTSQAISTWRRTRWSDENVADNTGCTPHNPRRQISTHDNTRSAVKRESNQITLSNSKASKGLKDCLKIVCV